MMSAGMLVLVMMVAPFALQQVGVEALLSSGAVALSKARGTDRSRALVVDVRVNVQHATQRKRPLQYVRFLSAPPAFASDCVFPWRACVGGELSCLLLLQRMI